MVAAGLTAEEVAMVMQTTPSAVRQALVRDMRREDEKFSESGIDDGLIWETPAPQKSGNSRPCNRNEGLGIRDPNRC